MASQKERGGWLDTWMFLMLAINIGGLIWFLGGYLVSAASPNGGGFFLPGVVYWAFYVNVAFLACNIISLSFLYRWKKWGFFSLWGGAMVILVLNLFAGEGWLSFLGLAGIVILTLMLRPKWKLFD
jgi:hypothetical protein